MRGEVSRITESIDFLFPNFPLLHLAHLHLRMLTDKATERLLSQSNSKPIIESAVGAVSLLKSPVFTPAQGLASPFEHQVAALTAVILAQGMQHDAVTVSESLGAFSQWCTDSGRLAPAWKDAIAAFIAKTVEERAKAGSGKGNGEAGGLRGLAEAAVGQVNGADGEAGKVEWIEDLEKGSLAIFE